MEEIIPFAMSLIQKEYKQLMLETIDKKKEIGGCIRMNDKELEKKYGEGTNIVNICKKGIADYHTHPPNAVLAKPKEDVFFLPPSDGDIHTALLNAISDEHKISFVLSIEGIYTVYIKSNAINCFSKDLEKISNKDKKELFDNNYFILEPIFFPNGSFKKFKPNNEYPNFSRLFNQKDSCLKIMRTAKTFEEAFARYVRLYEPFGILIEITEPHDKLKKRQ